MSTRILLALILLLAGAASGSEWKAESLLDDGRWLEAVAQVDLDPSVDGPELYGGGKSGILYSLHRVRGGGLDIRPVCQLAGEEIHTLAGVRGTDAAPEKLLVFTGNGKVVEVAPPVSPGRRWVTTDVAKLRGRVRDAIVVEDEDGHRNLFAVTWSGDVVRVRPRKSGVATNSLLEPRPKGLGRIAWGAGGGWLDTILYVTRDDGQVLRLWLMTYGLVGNEFWVTEPVFAGPPGPRGVASGRFFADPHLDTVAVYGDSGKVQIASREPDRSWKVETVFEGRGRGRWLAAAELDDRNGTRELVGADGDGRIILLSRNPDGE